MQDLIKISTSGELTTTSLVIAEQFGRSHGDVMRSIRKLISSGTIDQSDFASISYQDAYSREQPAIELTERGFLISMPFIGGNKAEVGQVRLVDAFLEAQARLREPMAPAAPALTAKTVLAESAARMLKMSDTSKIRMLTKIGEEAGISTTFLPDYSDERLTRALGDLLREHGADLSARAANLILMDLGYLEELERRSTGGTTKKFKSITTAGLEYGKNETSPQSPNQTQPRYYVDKFPALLDRINAWMRDQEGVA